MCLRCPSGVPPRSAQCRCRAPPAAHRPGAAVPATRQAAGVPSARSQSSPRHPRATAPMARRWDARGNSRGGPEGRRSGTSRHAERSPPPATISTIARETRALQNTRTSGVHRGVPGTASCRQPSTGLASSDQNADPVPGGDPCERLPGTAPIASLGAWTRLSKPRGRPPSRHRRGRRPSNPPSRDRADGATLGRRDANASRRIRRPAPRDANAAISS